MGDEETKKEIMKIKNQGKIKGFGRKIKPWDQEKWDKNKMDIVEKGNFNKF